MKTLTMNRVASAGLRANRRAYISLAMGLFLSIFLIATMALSVQGFALYMRQDVISKMGSEDAILYDCDLSDTQLMDMGWFDTIGHVNVIGSIQDKAKYIGYYDETATSLLNRRLVEGQMPEKPGQIAVESTVLDMLKLDIHAGDTLELEITPIDGKPETRQYTLTGILSEQSGSMSQSGSPMYNKLTVILDMPALLVCPDEPAFDTGRFALSRVLTLKPGKNGNKLIDAWDYDNSFIAIVSPYNGKLNTAYDYWGSDFMSPQVACVLILGVALLLVCGISISSSLESRLSQRVEQIGMLRAVGATSRQIRRLYGREAWLLALIVSPVAIATACLAVFIATKLLPDTLIFHPTPVLLLPILGFSVIVMVLSASLPLRRASKIMPMQVLRDTRTLKKLRTVKSRRRFRPARLIASRQAFLHPGRLASPAALVGLTMAVLLLAVQMGAQILSSRTSTDFLLQNYSGIYSRAFCDLIPDNALSSGDLSQIASMPEVGAVHAKREGAVILEIDHIPNYFLENEDEDDYPTSPLGYPTDYLKLDNGWQDGTDDMPENKLLFSRFNWAIQQTLETDRKLVSMNLYVVDSDSPIWKQTTNEGSIDLEAINRGEQVLAYMPDHYLCVDADGQVMYAPYPLTQSYKLFWKNDYFHPGQVLPLHQLRQKENDMSAKMQSLETQSDFLHLYDDALRLDATPTVGAILTDYSNQFWVPCLVTTEKGAKAMGLVTDYVESVDIRLNGPISIKTEERLHQRISGIAARGNMLAYNMLKTRRESQQEQRMAIITFAAVCVVFLAAAVGLISGNIRRRIIADTRSLGTLRAVGANADTIRGCYSGQILLTLLLGCAIGGLLFVVYWRFYDYLPSGASPALIAATEAAALLAVWGACMLMLNHSVHNVTKNSIIENIREL